MALTDIIQQLLEKAHKDAEAIAAETDVQKQIICTEYEPQEKKLMAEIDTKKKEGKEKLVRETNAFMAKENRKHNLQAKSQVMAKALEMFYEYLITLSDADYKSLMTGLVSLMNLSGSGVFYVPENRLTITTDIVPSGFQVQASEDLKGGAIIQQGNAQIDARFKNLVYSEFKTEFEAFFAQKLNLIAA
jgi:vacuolar-type H+-ATPase subunit E/Vma4